MKHDTTYRTERFKDVSIVHVAGDVDVAQTPSFERVLSEAANEDGCAIVIVSFLECPYVDTTLLGALVSASRTYGDRVRFIAPSTSAVGQILTMTGLVRMLTIHEDFNSALAAAERRGAAL